MADQPLGGRKVAILLAPAGTEQAEFTEPRKAVTDAGADVDVIGVQAGPARTVNHDLDPGETFRTAEYTNGDVVKGKWMRALLTQRERDLLKEVCSHPDVYAFGEIAKVDVGIVTGANKFFLVPDEVVRQYELAPWAHPMFGRSEHARGVVYDLKTHEQNRESEI